MLVGIIGKEVHTIAYPYGAYKVKVLEETEKYYQHAVTTKSGIATSNDLSHALATVRVVLILQLKNLINNR